MGAAEIRHRLGGISWQRVYQLTQRHDWPTPYDELVHGKVWRREDVEAWIATHRPDLEDGNE
jgi:prophage regulatory protein